MIESRCCPVNQARVLPSHRWSLLKQRKKVGGKQVNEFFFFFIKIAMVNIHIRGDCQLNVSLQKSEVYSVNCAVLEQPFLPSGDFPFQIYMALFHISSTLPKPRKYIWSSECYLSLAFQYVLSFKSTGYVNSVRAPTVVGRPNGHFRVLSNPVLSTSPCCTGHRALLFRRCQQTALRGQAFRTAVQGIPFPVEAESSLF